MKTTVTLKRLCQNVQIESRPGTRTVWEKQNKWQREAYGYRCRLSYQGRTHSFDFWMGAACDREPTAEDVLESLLLDASAGELDFVGFCQEFGFEATREAESTWKSCKKSRVSLRRLLGCDYDTFQQSER